MKAMLAAAVLLLVRRYGVFAGESIWAPNRVVSVSFMCGMVACGAAAGKPMFCMGRCAERTCSVFIFVEAAFVLCRNSRRLF